MSWSNFTRRRVLGATDPSSHRPLTHLRRASSTARRPPLGGTTNGVLPRTAGRRPQGGDDLGPHPVRLGEAAPRGHLHRRADSHRRPAKHPNPGTTNVQLVGVSRSFGVSRGECAACEKGHPGRADHRPPRSLGHQGSTSAHQGSTSPRQGSTSAHRGSSRPARAREDPPGATGRALVERRSASATGGAVDRRQAVSSTAGRVFDVARRRYQCAESFHVRSSVS